MIRANLLLLLLMFSSHAFAQIRPDVRGAPIQVAIQKTILPSMQREKAERDAIAAQCAQINADFRDKFRVANAEWETATAQSLRFFMAAASAMGNSSSTLLNDRSEVGIDMSALAKSLTEKSGSATLPTADNLNQLKASSEEKINLEMGELRKVEQYEYCVRKLERKNEKSGGIQSGESAQGM